MSRTCRSCPRPITSGSKSGLCRPCYLASIPPAKPRKQYDRIPCGNGCGRMMLDCPRRKTNLCKPCFARQMALSPEKREACRVAMLEKHADPAFRALHTERTTAGTRRSLLDPEKMKARQENGRRCGLLGLGVQKLGAGHPSRVAAGRKLSETRLAWCPPEYRDQYRELTTSKLVSAPDARRMILDLIEREIAAYRSGASMPQAQFIAVRRAIVYLKGRADADHA